MTETNIRSNRKTREGLVVSSKMNKTIVIAIVERVRHPKYDKFVTRTKKLYAHDEANDAKIGDKVRVVETRPLSKLKRWRVVEILERAKRFSKKVDSRSPTTVALAKCSSSRCLVAPAVVTHRLVMCSSLRSKTPFQGPV